MGFNLSGGAIINAYPTILGSSFLSTCSFPVSFTFSGVMSGYNGTAHTANMAVTGITTPGPSCRARSSMGPSFTGYATVVKWTVQRLERNLRDQHDEQQHHRKPGRGDDDFGTDGRI